MTARHTQRSLPRDAWPTMDRAAWEAAIRPGNTLLGGGRAAHLSTVTIQDLERRYSCFLDFASRQDLIDHGPHAAATVSEPIVRAYIEFLFSRVSSVTLAGSIRKVLRVATLIAPEHDWSWLRRFANRLEFNQRPANKRPRIVDMRRLYRLGQALMNQAQAKSDLPPLRQAQLYRDGLIITMLVSCELRLGAFTRLELGKTISRGTTYWSIHLPGTRGTKYRRPTEKPLPAELSDRIDQWVAVYRPRFKAAGQSSRCWLSRNGAITAGQIQRIVTARTKAAFGHPVNPHLFRNCAVTTINTEFSAESHLASAVLDHIDPRVTQKHYNHARMADAVKRHQRHLGLRD